jgi:RNA polymerase sigma factor (sigma-70 family)
MQSDKEIIEGIASHDSGTLTYIYDEIYPYIEAYVVHHGGTEDHARDVFQDAMLTIYKKIIANDLSVTCKFSTYLYAVCKNIWLQNRKKHYLRTNKLKEISAVAEPVSDYGFNDTDETKELFEKHFRRLGPDCQKILRLYFNEFPLEEICEMMGFSSVHHVSDKKYRCKKNLIERVKGDPNYRKFKNE